LSRLRPARAAEVGRALETAGFVLVRQSGSHAVYRHADGRWTTVPQHGSKDLGKGILRKILKDAGLSVDDFENMR